MLFPPGTCRIQISTSCYFSVTPPSRQRGLLRSSGTLALQSTSDFTFQNATYWWFSHMANLAKFFFHTVRMDRVTNATVILGTQSARPYLKQMYHASLRPSHRCWFVTCIFFKFFQNEQWMISLKKEEKKKKITQASQPKAFWQCLTTWVTQM